jgi:hypothetical protein
MSTRAIEWQIAIQSVDVLSSGQRSYFSLDLAILNSWILLSTCGAKYSQRDFRFLLVRNMIDEAGKLGCHRHPMAGRPSPAATKLDRLQLRHSQQWPGKGNMQRCRVCSERGVRKRSNYRSVQCKVGLCVYPCFQDYRTKLNL